MSEPTKTPAEGSQPAVVAAAPEKPAAAVAVKPPAAAPPKPPAKPAAKGPTRRDWLEAVGMSWIGVAWVAFTASMAAMTLGTVRFLFPNVLSEPPTTYKAGDVNAFETEKVDDKYKDLGFWVIKHREGGREILYALSTTCTHLGCTPNWLEGEKKFKCPCHGSGFYITGVNFEGPAPRPLERFAIRLDGSQVVVDKARKFQRELGQWEDGDSYLLV